MGRSDDGVHLSRYDEVNDLAARLPTHPINMREVAALWVELNAGDKVPV